MRPSATCRPSGCSPSWRDGRHKAGDILFRRGDVADEVFIPLSGRFRLAELGVDVPLGQMVGELGFIAPGNLRTQTLECTADGDALAISYQDLRQLYFQNPEFGFYFLRLTTGRLFENLARMEEELGALASDAACDDALRPASRELPAEPAQG